MSRFNFGLEIKNWLFNEQDINQSSKYEQDI
jgi:hypothetical protein